VRRALAALALALLSGCGQEADFDQRYKAAGERLETKAAAIDKELEAAQREAAVAAPPDQAAPSAPAIAGTPSDSPASLR
jgi:outer membrane murein-binding lipoprotein Lpp